MSDIDPTPATPVTIGDRLSWFRGDIETQLTTVSSKLDTVIARLDSLVTGGNLDSAPIVAAIEAMRGSSPNNTLETLHSQLSGLNTSLLKSNTATGADPDDSLQLTTVRGLLYLIYLAVAQIGIPPDSMDGSITNSGSLSIEGTRYIVWPEITGLTRSSNGVELTPDDSWNGYEIYIQTSAPSARMHNISNSTNIDPYPVNSWVTVDGTVTYAWSVDASYQVVGYMRVPAPTLGYVWEVEDTEAVYIPEIAGYRYLWKTTKYPQLTYINYGSAYRTLVGEWSGWRWTITGAGAFYAYGPNNTNTYGYGTAGTLPPGTTYVILQSATNQIRIELLPPL